MKALKSALFGFGLLLCVWLFAHGVRDAGGVVLLAAATPPAAIGQPPAAFAGAPDRSLSAEGVTLRYKEVGVGEPIIFIHGYSANLESLWGVARGFTSTHRVVALDVRGFGQSSKFADPGRFGLLIADDVVRLMDHLQIPRAHLVGHSMGALIAANVALRQPGRVSSMVLIAGPFYANRETFRMEVAPWVADLERGKGLTNFMQWLFPKMDTKLAALASAQALNANDLAALIAVMRSLPELAIPAVRASAGTTLVAVGTSDPLHSLSKDFAAASPGATLLELDGADHLNVLARPDLLRAMHALIERASARPPQYREAA